MNKNTKFEFMRMSSAIGLAILISLLLIFFVTDEPMVALFDLFGGPLTSIRKFGNVIELMVPLLLTGSAVAIIFSSSQINLGTEGAFYFGGVIAAIVALFVPISNGSLFFVAMLISGLVGVVIVMIPAYLKEKTGSNEIVSSLMMNYILLFLGIYILRVFLKDSTAGAQVSLPFSDAFSLGVIVKGTRIHMGLIYSGLFVFASYIFLFKTTIGLKIRTVGHNRKYAEYCGIDAKKTIFTAQMFAGFIAGVAGAIQLAGLFKRFSWVVLPGFGWDGIIVAALAKNNPKYVPFAAFFVAYIRIGADVMSRGTSGVPTELVSITQGIIIILIVAKQFLSKYRNKTIYKEAKTEIATEGGKE